MPNLLPSPVGINSSLVSSLLLGETADRYAPNLLLASDPFDRDTQLAWFMLNELSFGGWGDVADDAEWRPAVVSLRRACEDWFIRSVAPRIDRVGQDNRVQPEVMVEQILSASGPSISGYLARHGNAANLVETLLLRLPYQTKEADPHTFAIPRLSGATKRALCEIQSGEYGVGHRCTHAELFCEALFSVGIRDFTPVLSRLPGVGFATSNLVAMGGLNRSKRGMAIGQLALFEMDSVVPNQAMVDACDRLAMPTAVRTFFDVHVLADAEHQVIARQAFLIDYPRAEPGQLPNVVFGIQAQRAIDLAMAEHAISAWSNQQSALAAATRPLVAA